MSNGFCIYLDNTSFFALKNEFNVTTHTATTQPSVFWVGKIFSLKLSVSLLQLDDIIIEKQINISKGNRYLDEDDIAYGKYWTLLRKTVQISITKSTQGNR